MPHAKSTAIELITSGFSPHRRYASDMLTKPALLGLACVLLACSEVVVEPNDDGSGGASSVSAATGATAQSGGATTSSFSYTTGSAGGAGGEAPAPCPIVLDEENFYVEHDGPGWSHFSLGCEGVPFPSAIFGGGGRCSEGTRLWACEETPTADVQFFVMAFTGGDAEGIVDDVNASYGLSNVVVAFDEYGDVGEVVSGSYSGEATSPDGTVSPVSGAFRLCRERDTPPCP